MQSSQKEILYLLLLGVLINRIQMKGRKKKTRKRFWTKKWLLERNQFSHVNLLNELRFHPEDWPNYLRMDEDTYLKLLSLVTPIIQKKDTCMRLNKQQNKFLAPRHFLKINNIRSMLKTEMD